jgi:hypothetical protein
MKILGRNFGSGARKKKLGREIIIPAPKKKKYIYFQRPAPSPVADLVAESHGRGKIFVFLFFWEKSSICDRRQHR